MPSALVSEQSILRFGSFELAIDTGELLRSGATVKLSPQALHVLVLLFTFERFARLPRTVAKEIWGNSFVDAEHGLNRCIKQIRAALCDPADRPEYLETLRGRGYRFLVPAEEVDDSLVVVAPSRFRDSRKRFAVASFKNLSRRPQDAWIGTALSEMFTTELILDGKVLAFPLEDGGDLGSLAEGCADWIVSGSYTVVGKSGEEYMRLDVRVQKAFNGDILVVFSETNELSNLPELISRAGERLRSNLDSSSVQTLAGAANHTRIG